VLKDSFPASIPIPSGVYPNGTPYYGEGRLMLLGTFGGHGYYRTADAYQSYRWLDAKSIATSIGGHLTAITSAAENAFVASRVQSTGYFSWIGLQRNGASRTSFSWVTGEFPPYTNWGAQDPDNGGSTTTITEPYVFMYEGSGTWHDLVDFRLPFQVEFDAALIRWRQISGPANGSSLGVGVYPVCYERLNSITNLRDTCCFTVRVECSAPAIPTITTFSPTLGPIGINLSTGITKLLSTGKETIVVSPNPSKGQFSLQLRDFAATKAEVSVLDGKGVVIQKRSLRLTKNTMVAFDLSLQAKGLYFIRIVSREGTRVVKVLIQ
jgi:hypothetical protein